MLPTFLGIGAPRAGTTWLYEMLSRHPEVAMSAHRKEIHYLDLHYDRGRDWYEGFFPDRPDSPPRAVGEFTPHYLYSAEAARRAAALGSVEALVLIVRDPIDRAWSHYRFRRRQDNSTEDFASFLRHHPEAVEWGRYGHHLCAWLEHFDPSRLAVLELRRATGDFGATAATLGRLLGVDPGGFEAPPPANDSFEPRRPGLYAAAVRQARWLRRHDLDRVITAAKRSGAVAALKRRRPSPDAGGPDAGGPDADGPDAGTVRELWERYEPDVALLEALTGLDLASWRPTQP